jgi:adenosylcobyric acid synthase
MQALAAGVAPRAEMNPILLKPEGDSRSQLVVEGRARGRVTAADYHRQAPRLWPVVRRNLRALCDQFDVVVIEGAGSPVEVNLRDRDLVNMRVAREAAAPVLLVADIDRGGVFASLVGTMSLLRPSERARVAGVIVNKFRGDRSLFQPGLTFLERRLRRPVLGVVPWVADLGLPEEDSLGLPDSAVEAAPDGKLDVAVIRFPHTANFDDLDPLREHPGVHLRYVDHPRWLGEPDLIILPGTKTTRADLHFLRGSGLDVAVTAHAARGGCILGICGGYQMLGARVLDPRGLDGAAGESPGLGLLDAVTTYASQKATVQVTGTVIAEIGPLAPIKGALVSAYEIHMGRTAGSERPLFAVDDPRGTRHEGVCSPDGRVLGTYLHGLLHNAAVRDALLGALARRRGLALSPAVAGTDPFDRWAEVLRGALDVPLVLGLIGK